MITEAQITAADRRELEATPIALEMAAIHDWIAVRPAEDPDCFLELTVERLDDRGQLQITCECDRGAANEVCPEAVALVDKFREPGSPLLIQLHRRRPVRALAGILDLYRSAEANGER